MARVTRVARVFVWMALCCACGETARSGGRAEPSAGAAGVMGVSGASARTAVGGTGGNSTAGSATSGSSSEGGDVGAGGGAPAAECERSSDCGVVSSQCCSCEQLTLETAVAMTVKELEASPICPDVACAPCPEPNQPRTVHAACVSGQCVAVDVREQDYTACQVDTDCRLMLAGCCGICSALPLYLAYSVRDDSREDFRQCPESVACPAIYCPGPFPPVAEAYCGADGRCAGRAIQAAGGAGGESPD